MARKPATTADWQPTFTFDLSSGSAAAFRAIVDALNEWRKTQPRPALHLADGWHDFTPEISEQALMLNAGNRQVSFATVRYYAKQMQAGEWQETGQPALFDVDGNVVDMQHRAWASYLSGATFPTYVVNQRKAIKNGFAYIDNSKSRSNRDALYTAGLNGLSSVLAQVVRLGWAHESDALTPTSVQEVDKLSPIAAIRFVEARPNLRQGVRLMAGDHQGAAGIISWADVAGYMAYLILENHDEITLDEFMEQMAVDESADSDSAIAAFQRVMEQDKAAKKPMKKHMVLGYLIKCFNAWLSQEPVKRLSLKVNEPFPAIVGRVKEQQDAAE